MVTVERLKELLTYCPRTGLFRWRVTNSNRAKAGTVAGCTDPAGYTIIRIDRRSYRAHRLAWLYMMGKHPRRLVDHRNGLRSDNRFKNLRDVSTTENNRNAGRRRDNTSGITGVRWHKRKQKFEATIYLDGVPKYLGESPDFFEACCMRKSANNRHGFHKNHGAERKKYVTT